MKDCGYFVRTLTKADFTEKKTFEVDYIGLSMCARGTIHVTVNLDHYSIAEGDILLSTLKDLICIDYVSEDFEMKHIGITQMQLLHEASSQIFLFLKDIESSRAFLQDRENYPIKEFTISAFNAIYNFLALILSNEESDSRYEQGICVFRSLFLAMRDRPSLRQRQMSSTKSNGSLGYFNRFMLLLNVHCKIHHEVEFYAKELHITAQYLGRICKKHDGRSAKRIIDETLILQIKSSLKNTEKTIKELSYEYNFPNFSFMSSFFRRHTGTTPLEFRMRYRNGIQNEDERNLP